MPLLELLESRINDAERRKAEAEAEQAAMLEKVVADFKAMLEKALISQGHSLDEVDIDITALIGEMLLVSLRISGTDTNNPVKLQFHHNSNGAGDVIIYEDERGVRNRYRNEDLQKLGEVMVIELTNPRWAIILPNGVDSDI